MNNCPYCSIEEEKILHKLEYSMLVVPHRLHISPMEGGHLVAIPIRHTRSRFNLSPVELLEMDFLSLLGGKVLGALLSTDWFNFQDNGNWALAKPETQHVHLHIYGRKKNAEIQTYGEALRFPLKADLPNWITGEYTKAQIIDAKEFVLRTLDEDWCRKFNESIQRIRKA